MLNTDIALTELTKHDAVVLYELRLRFKRPTTVTIAELAFMLILARDILDRTKEPLTAAHQLLFDWANCVAHKNRHRGLLQTHAFQLLRNPAREALWPSLFCSKMKALLENEIKRLKQSESTLWGKEQAFRTAMCWRGREFELLKRESLSF